MGPSLDQQNASVSTGYSAVPATVLGVQQDVTTLEIDAGGGGVLEQFENW